MYTVVVNNPPIRFKHILWPQINKKYLSWGGQIRLEPVKNMSIKSIELVCGLLV